MLRLAKILSQVGLPVVLASGAKAVLQLAVATAVVTSASSEDATIIFQLLFFQTILISLISASGYMQGYSAQVTGASIVELFGSRALLGLGVLALTPFVIGVYPGAEKFRHEVLLIALGAVATGLAAPLQGYLSKVKGNSWGFLPSAVSAIVFLLLFFAIDRTNAGSAILILTLSQVVALPLFVCIAVFFPARARGEAPAFQPVKILTSLKLLVVVGTMNTLGLFSVFFVREYWSAQVEADVSSVVFFILRVADSILGVTTLLLVRLDLRSFFGFVDRAKPYVLVPTLCVLSLLIVRGAYESFSLIYAALIAQVVVELVRYPSSAAYVAQASDPKSLRYSVFIIAPVALAFTSLFIMDVIHLNSGMQSFLIVSALSGLFVHTLQRRFG